MNPFFFLKDLYEWLGPLKVHKHYAYKNVE